jgi:hypothetical protein
LEIDMPRMNYEEKFRDALDDIAHYDSPERLRRNCEKHYGLEYVEALEMAYENIREEARVALRGYRKPPSKPPYPNPHGEHLAPNGKPIDGYPQQAE